MQFRCAATSFEGDGAEHVAWTFVCPRGRVLITLEVPCRATVRLIFRSLSKISQQPLDVFLLNKLHTSTHFHVPLRMNYNDFGNPLIFCL